MSNHPSQESVPPLSTDQLLGLFKHWDGIVSAKETLFLPVILGVLTVAAVSWENVDARVTAGLGAASLLLYLYHLMIIRRLGEFQDRIFQVCVSKGLQGIAKIVKGRGRIRFGVRCLRLIAFPVLGVLWAMFVYLKRCHDISEHRGDTLSSCAQRWVAGIFIGVPLVLALYFCIKDKLSASRDYGTQGTA
ncbi:MAG TPA: hypothetical protein VM431_09135 [Phycisphaerae bacterium]|nr:hypothetical protein [Phycisphaerae bacterium]